jgi:hypothetical protein
MHIIYLKKYPFQIASLNSYEFFYYTTVRNQDVISLVQI